MPEWKMSTYGSNETMNFGWFTVMVIYRSGTKDRPIPDNERYEFSINGKVSVKKFGSAEETKRVALASLQNKLAATMELVKGLQG